MRRIFLSAFALCALATCSSAPENYTEGTFLECALGTEHAHEIDWKAFPAVAKSAYAYVLRNAPLHTQDALAVALRMPAEKGAQRCPHDVPWMYAILDVATGERETSSGRYSLFAAFNTLAPECITRTIYDNGKTPLDAVLANVSHLDRTRVWLLTHLFHNSGGYQLHAPAVTFALVQTILGESQTQGKANIDRLEAFSVWVDRLDFYNAVPYHCLGYSAAANPALVLNLATMYNYGRSIISPSADAHGVSAAHVHSSLLFVLAFALYSKLGTAGKGVVNSVLTKLNMIGFNDQVRLEIQAKDVEALSLNIEPYQRNPAASPGPFSTANFMTHYLTALITPDNTTLVDIAPNSPFPLLHDGQFSLQDYALMLPAAQVPDPFVCLLKTSSNNLGCTSTQTQESLAKSRNPACRAD